MKISGGYCEVCGFGFHMNADQTYSNVTCRMPRQAAIERGLLSADPNAPVQPAPKAPEPRRGKAAVAPVVAPASPPLPAPEPPLVQASPEPIPPPAPVEELKVQPSVMESPPEPPVAASSTATPKDRVLASIRDLGLIGKAKIIEASGVSETDYSVVIKALVAQKAIVQEGERRGAKYRIAL
jgi:hypothetical protein